MRDLASRLRLLAALAGSTLALSSTACGGALSLSAPFTPPESGGAPWVEATSAHFILHTDLPASDAPAALEELERTYATLQDIAFPFDTKPKQRTRVILFQRESEYEVVAPRGTDGVFRSGFRLHVDSVEPVAILFGDLTNRVRRGLLHELTHRFAAFYFPQAPPWLNEGLAGYYETMSLEDGKAILGRPTYFFKKGLTWYKGYIPTASVPSVRDIVRLQNSDVARVREELDSREAEHEDAKRVTINYAASWALVHLLKNGPERYRSLFNDYLTMIGEGKPPLEAWETATAAIDSDQLEQDFRASLTPAGAEVVVHRTPYRPPVAPLERQRAMTPAEVHLLWAALSPTRAEADVDAAIRLDPRSTRARLFKARLNARRGALEQAERDLTGILTLNPKDPECLYALFSFYMGRAEEPGASRMWMQRAEPLVPRLLAGTTTPTVRNSLAWFLGLSGRADEALPLALGVVEDDPSCWECYDTLALLLAQKGELDKAVEIQSLAVNVMSHGTTGRDARQRLDEYKKAAAAARPLGGPGPGPASTPGAQTSAKSLRGVIEQRADSQRQCYQKGLARNPALAGKVLVRIVIEDDGSIGSAMDAGSTLPDEDVIACILDDFLKLRFPAPEGKTRVTVVYPLVLGPGDGAATSAKPPDQ